jgi:hypothetical protein
MSALAEFGGLDNATLAALTLELASQLHIERTRRLALEAVLSKRGILTAAEIDAAGEDPAFREEASRAADLAIRKLLRVLSESPDERVPLRGEAPGN